VNDRDNSERRPGNGAGRGRDGDRKPFGDRKPAGDRAASGERKPYGDRKPAGDRRGAPGTGRDGSHRGGAGRTGGARTGAGPRDAAEPQRPAWQTRVERPRDENRAPTPIIPDEITAEDCEYTVRLQLKTLTAEKAEKVARHLAMVSLLIEVDPELAHRHAQAAATRAGRIAVVHETLGITAYTVGDYALALRELLAFRRMTASNDQLPLIVDSERGLGRPQKALEAGREVDRAKLSPMVRVNLAIAMSGARLDLGENSLALTELEIPELNPAKVFDFSAPLFWAYSDTLEVLGRSLEAQKWADLAERAEKAFQAPNSGENESIVVLEEIEIPTFQQRESANDERKQSRRDSSFSPGGDRGRDGGRDGGSRGFAPRTGSRDGGFNGARDGGRDGFKGSRDGGRSPRDGGTRGPRDGGPRRDG
jgi:hypothetical protein